MRTAEQQTGPDRAALLRAARREAEAQQLLAAGRCTAAGPAAARQRAAHAECAAAAAAVRASAVLPCAGVRPLGLANLRLPSAGLPSARETGTAASAATTARARRTVGRRWAPCSASEVPTPSRPPWTRAGSAASWRRARSRRGATRGGRPLSPWGRGRPAHRAAVGRRSPPPPSARLALNTSRDPIKLIHDSMRVHWCTRMGVAPVSNSVPKHPRPKGDTTFRGWAWHVLA